MDKILNIIMELIGLLLAVLILIFKDRMDIIVILFAVFAILYGILFMIKKKTYGLVFLSVGLSVSVSIIIYRMKILVVYDAITFAMCLSFVVIMLLSFLLEFIRRKKIFEIYTIEKDAEVVDLLKNKNTSKEMYLPLYAYKIGNEVYEVEYFKYFIKNVPSIGSKKKIWINPNDHLDVFFDQETKDKVFNICCYLFLIIISLFIIFSLF